VPTPLHQLPVLAAHRAQLIDRKTSSIDLPCRDEIFGPDLIAIRPIPFCNSTAASLSPLIRRVPLPWSANSTRTNNRVRSPRFCLLFPSNSELTFRTHGE
jgi:hypothetical protein